MQRIFILLIAAVVYTKPALAQSAYEQSLLETERKIFYSKSDSERSGFMFAKLDTCISHKDYSVEALNELKRTDSDLLADTNEKKKFLWNASLLSLLGGEQSQARNYFIKYKSFSADTSAASLLLEIMINNGSDSVAISGLVKKLSEKNKEGQCLNCINETAGYKRKHKNAYIAASAIVPGLGSTINGNIFKGASSLVLNSGAVIVVYALIKNQLYANAVFFGAGMFIKFYAGNIRLTSVLFDRKAEEKKNILAKDCENMLGKILKTSPVNFR